MVERSRVSSFSALCVSQTDVILLGMSLSHSFLRQSSRHSGLMSFAVGIPESILGLRHSHSHFHLVETSFVAHRLQSAVNMVFLIFQTILFIMLKASPV